MVWMSSKLFVFDSCLVNLVKFNFLVLDEDCCFFMFGWMVFFLDGCFVVIVVVEERLEVLVVDVGRGGFVGLEVDFWFGWFLV